MAKTSAQKKTEKELLRIEKELEEIYSTAQKELSEKWNSYMERADKRLAKKQQAYNSALKSGNKKEIKEAKEILDRAKSNITFEDRRYRAMVDDVTTRLANKNQIALDYINGRLPNVYTWNYNEISTKAMKFNLNFTMVNEQAVANMVKDGDIQLPKKKIKIPKDKQWNTKKIHSQVMQGIVQGEDMKKIAKRLEPIVDGNKVAAMRNARTLVGGVENKGRLDSYKKLEKDGAVLKKTWIAGADGRTRDWHIDMDGQTVELDEMFVDGLGNELEYPKDPRGAPETIYNCRCAVTDKLIGKKNDDGSITYFDFEEKETLHDRQIAQEKYKRQIEKEQKDYHKLQREIKKRS